MQNESPMSFDTMTLMKDNKKINLLKNKRDQEFDELKFWLYLRK